MDPSRTSGVKISLGTKELRMFFVGRARNISLSNYTMYSRAVHKMGTRHE